MDIIMLAVALTIALVVSGIIMTAFAMTLFTSKYFLNKCTKASMDIAKDVWDDYLTVTKEDEL